MTEYNKYEIYVDKIDLANYIEENCIVDKNIMFNERMSGDFFYVEKDKNRINFFSEDNIIDGWSEVLLLESNPNCKKVTAEEFLIAIGYLGEDSHKPKTTEKLKVEDVYYLDSFYPSDTDYLWLSKDGKDICLQVREGGCEAGVYLSPESLISLGKDLIQIGVSKQIEEESNED